MGKVLLKRGTPDTIPPLPFIVASGINAGVVGDSYPGFTVGATDGASPLVFHATGLPPPLAINSSTGVVPPATLTTAGTYVTDIWVVDALGRSSNHLSPTIVVTPSVVAGAMVLSIDGLDITIHTTLPTRDYVAYNGACKALIIGSYPATVTIDSCAITPGTQTNIFVGGVMVDPQGLTKQGWDSRRPASNPVSGIGPGMIYDASLNHALPLTLSVYPDNSPKTVWFYRGLDTLQTGGAESGGYAIVQLTLVATDPGADAIKPPGLYVAGGKPQLTRADIDYNAITQVGKPTGAIEPNWNDLRMLNRPLVQTGAIASASQVGVCNPAMSQDTYPANQAGLYTNRVIIGAISNIARRNELIEKIVTCGLEVKASLAFDPRCYVSIGGFGLGFRQLLYFAGWWLADSSMRAKPASYTNTYFNSATNERFEEDEAYYLGAATGAYPSGKPLMGARNQVNWPTGPFGGNHDARDVNGLREPNWMARNTGNALAGTTTTIQLDTGTAAGTIIAGVNPSAQRLYRPNATAADKIRFITGYNSTTRTVTVDTVWNVAPTVGEAYETWNGGLYQTIHSTSGVGAAIALKAAGLRDDYRANSVDGYFQYYQRWHDIHGILEMMPTNYIINQTENTRVYNDPSGVWEKKFYDQYGPLWP